MSDKNKYKGNIPPKYIGERILYLRKTQEISRPELIRLCGISNSTLSRIEDNPNTVISAQNIVKFAEIFGVSCDYLITGKVSTNTDVLKHTYDSPRIYELVNSFTSLSTIDQDKVLEYIYLLKKF